jgi:methylated-DNA-[protein]-cysteine S-methyltransferase
VLETLSRIPFGEVLGYGELASRAGWAGAARAVGQVMATNPLPLVIPCHRVVAAGGGLGGFTGGIAIKRALLAHEGISLGE